MSSVAEDVDFLPEDVDLLKNPTLSVENWVAEVDNDPILVSIAEPKSVSKNFMQTEIKYEVRTSSKNKAQTTYRSYADFKELHHVLLMSFPGACIPALPPSQTLGTKKEGFLNKRMNLLQAYLQAVSDHPFFRNDFIYEEFVDQNIEHFDRKKAKKRSSGKKKKTKGVPKREVEEMSEGALRWLQALSQTETQNAEDKLIRANKELELISDSLKKIKHAATHQVERLDASAKAARELYKALGLMLENENEQISLMSGKAISLMTNESITMAPMLQNATSLAGRHAALLETSYGPDELRRTLLNPIEFEIKMVSMWRTNLEVATKYIKQHRDQQRLVAKLEEELRAAEEEDKDGPKAANLREKKLPEALNKEKRFKIVAQQYERGTLGIELQRFRATRTLRMEKIIEQLKSFHIAGAGDLGGVWDGTNVDLNQPSLDDIPAGSFFKSKKDRAQRRRWSNISAGSFRENTDNEEKDRFITTQPMNAGLKEGDEAVTLRAIKKYRHKKADELDLQKDEILTGVRNTENTWYATNKDGKSGLVHAEYVFVKSSDTPATPEMPRPTSILHSVPPGLAESNRRSGPPPGLGSGAKSTPPPPMPQETPNVRQMPTKPTPPFAQEVKKAAPPLEVPKSKPSPKEPSKADPVPPPAEPERPMSPEPERAQHPVPGGGAPNPLLAQIKGFNKGKLNEVAKEVEKEQDEKPARDAPSTGGGRGPMSMMHELQAKIANRA